MANFHRATVHELAELTAAAGLDHPNQFKPIHISRRVSPKEVVTFDDVYPALDDRRAADRHGAAALDPAVEHGRRPFVPRRGLIEPKLLRIGRAWPSNWGKQERNRP